MTPVVRYEARSLEEPLWVARGRNRIPAKFRDAVILEPDPEQEPPTEPGPITWDPSVPATSFNRTMYPDASHPLGDYRGPDWQDAMWLPSGSTYPVPSGWLKFYGPQIDWRAVKGKRLRIRCPEVFVDPVMPPMIPDASCIIQGLVVQWTGWNVKEGLTNPDGSPKPMRLGYNESSNQPVIANNYLTIQGNGDSEAETPDYMFRAVEGGGIKPAPDGFVYTTEFFNYDGKSDQHDTLVLQGLRCANADTSQGLSWISIGGTGQHSGGDIMQWWNGPSNLYVLGLVAVSTYQGIFDQSTKFGSSDTRSKNYERIYIKGDRGSSSRQGGNAYLWWDTTQGDLSVTRSFGTGDRGVYIDPVPGITREKTIWRASDFSHDDPIVIGAAPSDFVPLAEAVQPWTSTNGKWALT